MKKPIQFFLIITFSLKTYYTVAQGAFMSRSDYMYNLFVSEENKIKERNKAHNLKQKNVIDSKHPSNNTMYGYDDQGRVIYYKMGKKEVKSGYGADEQKKFVVYLRKGKLIELDSFKWEGKNLKECSVFDKDKKLFKRERYKHDSTYVTEYLYEKLKKNKLTEFRKHIYEYYPDYSYKKITYYKKGKPLRYSVFDCNPIGQNKKIDKDSTYSCVKYDVDSLGNKIKVSVTNDRGFSWKSVEYFNNNDELTACKTYDLKKNEALLYAYYYVPGTNLMTKFISYKRSKEYYRIENVFNNDGNCTEYSRYSKGKLKSGGRNVFNDKGLITLTERFNKKGKKTEEIIYEYQYY